jgi:hypothetical protein
MTLTDVERADRKLSGIDLQRQIVELGAMLGWLHMHVRPAQTAHGWRTPITGQLGKGWPDLVMVQPLRRRTLAVEVKRQLGDPLTPDQEFVHRILREAGWTVAVWKPSDMSDGTIQAELSRGADRG